MIRVTDKQYWMDNKLLTPLDSYVYNMKRGFDFMIMITGNGMKRVGKTTLATQIGYYCSQMIGTPFSVDNVVFGGQQLMDAARKLPHMSVIIDDESQRDFSNLRQLDSFNKALDEFFKKCGKFNHLYILVTPDFFDFSNKIALVSTELLVNVKRYQSEPLIVKAGPQKGREVVRLERGLWETYDRTGKKRLYYYGKEKTHPREYNSRFRMAFGDFVDYWTIDREAYETKKDAFIALDEAELGKKKDLINPRFRLGVNNMLKAGVEPNQIAQWLGVTKQYISMCRNKVEITP